MQHMTTGTLSAPCKVGCMNSNALEHLHRVSCIDDGLHVPTVAVVPREALPVVGQHPARRPAVWSRAVSAAKVRLCHQIKLTKWITSGAAAVALDSERLIAAMMSQAHSGGPVDDPVGAPWHAPMHSQAEASQLRDRLRWLSLCTPWTSIRGQ